MLRKTKCENAPTSVKLKLEGDGDEVELKWIREGLALLGDRRFGASYKMYEGNVNRRRLFLFSVKDEDKAKLLAQSRGMRMWHVQAPPRRVKFFTPGSPIDAPSAGWVVAMRISQTLRDLKNNRSLLFREVDVPLPASPVCMRHMLGWHEEVGTEGQYEPQPAQVRPAADRRGSRP